MKKILVWTTIILSFLLILIYAFNVEYLLKGVRTIYLTGNNTALFQTMNTLKTEKLKTPFLNHGYFMKSITLSHSLKI